MELAVSKIGQKVCHCFVLRYKNIKIVNSVQVQVARTREGVNILSNAHSGRYVTSQNPTAMVWHLALSYGVRNTINPSLDKQDQVTKTKTLWGLIMTL